MKPDQPQSGGHWWGHDRQAGVWHALVRTHEDRVLGRKVIETRCGRFFAPGVLTVCIPGPPGLDGCRDCLATADALPVCGGVASHLD